MLVAPIKSVALENQVGRKLPVTRAETKAIWVSNDKESKIGCRVNQERKALDEELKVIRNTQIQNYRRIIRNQFRDKQAERRLQTERQRQELLHKVVEDRKKIISRSLNWRIKVREIEESSLKKVIGKPKPSLWMWKLPGTFNKGLNNKIKLSTSLQSASPMRRIQTSDTEYSPN